MYYDDDLDTILSYLSSKINKIFCDREFVSCVKEDFNIILQNTGNRCVVFPKLKPIFLKVLRHQAVIFDLSVFCIGSGPNQVAVVCKKGFLKEQSDECPFEENKHESKAMDGEENFDKTNLKKSNRTNRPTQTYYVPPAQRSTTKKKIDHENNKTSNKTRIKSKSKHKDVDKTLIEKKEESVGSNILPSKTGQNDKMHEELVPFDNLCTEFVDNASQLQNSREQECGTCLDVAQLLNSREQEESLDCLKVTQLPNIGEQEECGACLDIAQLPNSREHESGACLDVEETLHSLSLFSSNINEFSKSNEKENSNEYIGSPSDNLEMQFNNLSNDLVQIKNSCSKDVRNTSLNVISLVSPPETNEHIGHPIKVQKAQTNPELLPAFPGENQNVQNSICGNSENGSYISNESFKTKVGLHDLYTLPASLLQECIKNPKLGAVVENLKIQHQANQISSLSSSEDDKIIKLLETILKEENNYETEMNGYIKEQASKEVLIQKLVSYFVDKDLDPALSENLSLSNSASDGNSNMDSLLIIPPSLLKLDDFSDVHIVQSEQQMHNDSHCSDIPPLYISYNDDIGKKKTLDCDIDNENEEMQRVIENINRKSRSLIKHNIRNVNTLRIDENEHVPQHSSNVYENNKQCSINTSKSNSIKEDHDNLSNWEDMFDESGELQPEYIGKIVKRIGCDVKIVKASHDYSAYENTKYQDLEHVIELYDFPSTFKTQDLIQLYRGAYQDATYVKWCDDTHALLVLSSPAQAQRALQIKHEVIKSRPLSQASTTAALTASSADLKPAMKRPQTSMQTARRMINTHLGTKSTLSKEEVEQERRALRDAREQRRQERQNEKDAWEGRPRSAKSYPFS